MPAGWPRRPTAPHARRATRARSVRLSRRRASLAPQRPTPAAPSALAARPAHTRVVRAPRRAGFAISGATARRGRWRPSHVSRAVLGIPRRSRRRMAATLVQWAARARSVPMIRPGVLQARSATLLVSARAASAARARIRVTRAALSVRLARKAATAQSARRRPRSARRGHTAMPAG